MSTYIWIKPFLVKSLLSSIKSRYIQGVAKNVNIYQFTINHIYLGACHLLAKDRKSPGTMSKNLEILDCVCV